MSRVIRFLKLLNARQRVGRETLYTAVTFSVPVYLFVFYPGTLLEKIAAAGVALGTLLILIGALLFALLMLGEPIARGVKIVRDTWRDSAEKQKRDAKRKAGYEYDPYETAPMFDRMRELVETSQQRELDEEAMRIITKSSCLHPDARKRFVDAINHEEGNDDDR